MENLDQIFSALSDGRRRAILARLCEGEVSFSEIAVPFGLSQTGVTRHINILKNAGLVRVVKRGRTRYCLLEAGQLKGAADWFKHYEIFWTGILDQLAGHVEESPE